MQVSILTANAFERDAIGNQVAEKLSFFLDRGAEVRVYAQSTDRLHSVVRPYCHSLDVNELAGDEWEYLTTCDVVIVEYGQHYPLLQILPFLVEAKPRIVFQYYGITPPKLWDAHNRETLEQAAAHRGLAWCADVVATPSRFACRELLDATGLPHNRTRSLSLPVNIDFFKPGPDSGVRERLGLGDAAILLFVGRLAPNKRLPVLIQSLARLRDMASNVHAVIIGDIADVYEMERKRCQELADSLGVRDRLHFLCQVSTEYLRDAYRSADVLVIPSIHEGFCIPVIEAMACGLPVVAARTSALKETIGDAGLSFAADDPINLARQVMRILSGSRNSEGNATPYRVAVVSTRYGDGFVGGAETSLRRIAETLHASGHSVEVFTTGARSEVLNGIPVHRYRAEGESTALMATLRARKDEFDVVITGPYLLGLSADVAAEFGARTILVPCFHDEPTARLASWHETYADIGGIWYHSPEEQKLAETDLGFHSPRSRVVGTYLNTTLHGNPERGRARVGAEVDYLVYAGRYIKEKGLIRLLDYARRYSEERPGRFVFAFMGQGNISIPDAAWARNLGLVSETVKSDVLSGAVALVHFSPNESLSLVMLEAWSQGVPVIGTSDCEVLHGHLHRGAGGLAIESYESFAGSLDALWDNPGYWNAMGTQGRAYVHEHYGSKSAFASRLNQGIEELKLPLAERMRQRGLTQAANSSRRTWRDKYARLIEELLDTPPRINQIHLDVEPRSDTRTVTPSANTLLIPIRVVNRGTLPALPTGAAAVKVHGLLSNANGSSKIPCDMALPALLMPGQKMSLTFPIPVPNQVGLYQMRFAAARIDADPDRLSSLWEKSVMAVNVVRDSGQTCANGCSLEFLSELQTLLATAQKLQTLPDDYADITQGRFAKWKAWIKQKLLGNFKHAYVDVMSRQQSAFNRQVVASLQELAECCSTLDSVVASQPQVNPSGADLQKLRAELAEARAEIRTLEKLVQARNDLYKHCA